MIISGNLKTHLNALIVLSIIILLAFIPALVISLLQFESMSMKLLATMIEISLLIGGIYSFVVFNTYAEKIIETNEFRQITSITVVVIAIQILAAIILLFLPLLVSTVTDMILLYVSSVLMIIYGIKMIKYNEQLFNFGKTYGYLTIIIGVLYMLIITMPVGILLAIPAGIVYIIMISKAAGQLDDEGNIINVIEKSESESK